MTSSKLEASGAELRVIVRIDIGELFLILEVIAF